VIAELASVSFPALGTTALLCVADAAGLPAARVELERELIELDLACSRFRQDSELTCLNAAAGTGPVQVCPRLLEAVEVALAAAESSGGLVDPTIGRSLRLAGYDRRFATVRLRDGSSFRARFEPAPGWRGIELDRGGGTIALEAGIELDLGATVRRWLAGSVELHHLIDPRNGRPADSPWRTVTVAAGSCVDANVASTAAIVLGEEAPGWLAARGLAARLVRQSGDAELAGAWPEDAA
jgi:thiamine biosynthesis lipoprotein